MMKGLSIIVVLFSGFSPISTLKLPQQLKGDTFDGDVIDVVSATLRRLPVKCLRVQKSDGLVNQKTSSVLKRLHHEWVFDMVEDDSAGSVLIVFASEEDRWWPSVKLSDWILIVSRGGDPEDVINNVNSSIYHSGVAIVGLDVYTWLPSEVCLKEKRIRWVDRWVPGHHGGALTSGGRDISLQQETCDLGGCSLRCGTFEWPPFIMTIADKYSTNQIVVPGRTKYNSGLEILMLQVISERCNVVFQFVEYPIQTWDVLSTEVNKGELDVAAAAMMFSSNKDC